MTLLSLADIVLIALIHKINLYLIYVFISFFGYILHNEHLAKILYSWGLFLDIKQTTLFVSLIYHSYFWKIPILHMYHNENMLLKNCISLMHDWNKFIIYFSIDVYKLPKISLKNLIHIKYLYQCDLLGKIYLNFLSPLDAPWFPLCLVFNYHFDISFIHILGISFSYLLYEISNFLKPIFSLLIVKLFENPG